MVLYCENIQDFIDNSKALYGKNPSRMRCSTKVRGASDEMIFKVTDDVTVLKYRINNLTKNEAGPE